MTIITKKIAINSNKRLEIIDITEEINKVIDDSKVDKGIVNLFSKHSTSSIIINENEVGLVEDMENILKELVPDENSYNHDIIDNNADSHLRAMLLGPSETIPISDNKLDLGTWQSVFFIELDGPRTRNITVTIFY